VDGEPVKKTTLDESLAPPEIAPPPS